MRTITVAAATIELQAGEHYAGLVLNADGTPSHHLVLMGEAPERMAWQAAVDWAQAQGGTLPSRREQSLLFANAKDHFQRTWYWSAEEYQDADDEAAGSFAGYQFFNVGHQGFTHKSCEGRARAVRRLTA